MGKADEYVLAIRKMGRYDLIRLWKDHSKDEFDDSFWKKGKVLEYVALRAFEIERKGCVTYPYDVYYTACEGPDQGDRNFYTHFRHNIFPQKSLSMRSVR